MFLAPFRFTFMHLLFKFCKWVTFLLCPLITLASPRDSIQAIKIAKSKFSMVANSKTEAPIAYYALNEEEDYYVVHQKDMEGWMKGYIVVPKDSNLPPVLAFSDTNTFYSDKLPAHIQSWMKGYAMMAEYCSNSSDALNRLQRYSVIGNVDVEPLLDNIQWGQGSPYNILCPEIDGEKSPAGCVATALAQLMTYHRYPAAGTGETQYATRTYALDISYDFTNHPFQWDMIHESYGAMEIESDEMPEMDNSGYYKLRHFAVDNNLSPVQCAVSIGGFTNIFSNAINGKIAIFLLDEWNNCLGRVSEYVNIKVDNPNIVGTDIEESICLSIPKSTPKGQYILCCAYYDYANSKWNLVKNSTGTVTANIPIYKEDNEFVIDNHSYTCATSIDDASAVANIMFAVGASVKMDYGKTSSGAYNKDALFALYNHLCYDQDVSLLSYSNCSDSIWHSLLQKELSDGRPVYYSGSSNGGGHAFVIDGMRRENELTYYHVNWGWDGLCDGYYLLNTLKPAIAGTGGVSNANYAQNAEMIIGIAPEDLSSNYRLLVSGLQTSAQNYFPGQNLSGKIASLSLMSANLSCQGSLYLDLKPVNSSEEEKITLKLASDVALNSERVLNDYYFRVIIPDSLCSGEYTMNFRFIPDDGNNMETYNDFVSTISVMPTDEWIGGNNSTTRQYLYIDCYDTDYSFVASNAYCLRFNRVINALSSATIGDIAFLVCGKDGRIIAPLNEKTQLALSGYSELTNCSLQGKFPKCLPNGEYDLCLGFKPTNMAQWSFVYQINDMKDIWTSTLSLVKIPFKVEYGRVYINNVCIETVDVQWTSISSVIREDSNNIPIYLLDGKLAKTLLHKGVVIMGNKKFMY